MQEPEEQPKSDPINPYTGRSVYAAKPKKKPNTALVVIGCIIGVIIIGSMAKGLQNAGVIPASETADDDATGAAFGNVVISHITDAATTAAPETVKLTAEQLVTKAAADAFGEEAEVAYMAADGDTPALAMIDIKVKTIFTVGITTNALLVNIMNTMKNVYAEYPDIAYNFIVYYPSVDAYGNTGDKEVLYAYYSVDTLNKVKWDNFYSKNLNEIADTFRADDEIQKYLD